jgi:hypothetical protein
MKKIIIKLVATLLISFQLANICLAIGIAETDESSIELQYDIDHPTIVNSSIDDEYKSVIINGLHRLATPGEPALPYLTARILIPFNKDIRELTVSRNEEEYIGNFQIEPAQKPRLISGNTTINDTIRVTPPKQEIYSSNNPYPSESYNPIGFQSKMGYNIYLVNLYPLKYIPASRDLFFYKNITITVKFSNSSMLASGITTELQEDRSEIIRMIDNPNQINSYSIGNRTVTNGLLLSGSYKYIIITNRNFAQDTDSKSFTSFANFKNSNGMPATVVTVEQIYSNYAGRDNQERIRNFIKDAYNNNGARYILLGGDADGGNVGGESGDNIVPARTLWCDWDNCQILSDLYYACLDGNYDSDGDSIFGEPTDGAGGADVDLFAEVYVGRAPVDSLEEVHNFVSKTMAYENSELSDPWPQKALMVGEKLDATPTWGGDFKDLIKTGSSANGYTTKGFPSQFTVSTIYDRDWAGNNWPVLELVARINSNVKAINHLGHGNSDWLMKMSHELVSSLTNTQYFLAYTQACYVGAFDNKNFWDCTTNEWDCMAERLVTDPHGAFAIIANSRYGSYWSANDGPSEILDRGFWNAIFGEGIAEIGRANQVSKEDNIGGISYLRYTYLELNLLGDPAAKFQNVASWKGLGGYVASSPSIVVDNLGKTEVWVKGGDNSLWVNIDGSWRPKGGVLSSDPFAAKDYNGKIHVLVRGGDNAAWDYIYDPSSATGHWKGLGGYLTSGPTAAMEPSYHTYMRVAAKGGDNALWQCDLNINTESFVWYTNGGCLTSRPYVIFDPAGRQHTLVRGSDNALWDCEGILGSDAIYHWTWCGLGGNLMSGPTASIEPSFTNYVAVFAKGADSALWMADVYTASQPETSIWYRLGGVIASDPFVVADSSNNRIHAFVRGSDSALWECIFSTYPWNPNGNQWQCIGGAILPYTQGATIRISTQAFAVGTDHALWRNIHTTFSASPSEANSTLKQDEPPVVNHPTGGANSGGGKEIL